MVFPDQCHCFLLGHHGTAGLEIKTVFQVIISDQREVKGSGPSWWRVGASIILIYTNCPGSQRAVKLAGGNSNIFYVHPYLGKIPNLTHIFQMGWNHQLEKNMPLELLILNHCFLTIVFTEKLLKKPFKKEFFFGTSRKWDTILRSSDLRRHSRQWSNQPKLWGDSNRRVFLWRMLKTFGFPEVQKFRTNSDLEPGGVWGSSGSGCIPNEDLVFLRSFVLYKSPWFLLVWSKLPSEGLWNKLNLNPKYDLFFMSFRQPTPPCSGLGSGDLYLLMVALSWIGLKVFKGALMVKTWGGPPSVVLELEIKMNASWWQLKHFFMVIPIWGRFPFWLICFKWVETTNQVGLLF